MVVATRRPDSPVLAHNPTGEVPTLVTADGTVLSESRLICGYLDTLHDGPPVVPVRPSPAALSLEGIVTGVAVTPSGSPSTWMATGPSKPFIRSIRANQIISAYWQWLIRPRTGSFRNHDLRLPRISSSIT